MVSPFTDIPFFNRHWWCQNFVESQNSICRDPLEILDIFFLFLETGFWHSSFSGNSETQLEASFHGEGDFPAEQDYFKSKQCTQRWNSVYDTAVRKVT